jgi:hypothetical protein
MMDESDDSEQEGQMNFFIALSVATDRLRRISETVFLRQELGHSRIRENWLSRSAVLYNEAEHRENFHFTRAEMTELTGRLRLPEVLSLLFHRKNRVAAARDDGG